MKSAWQQVDSHRLVLLCLTGLTALFFVACDGSEERRARYAEKKPPPRPLQRTFPTPKQTLPQENKKKQLPTWIDYAGQDMHQITGMASRNILIVFYADWCNESRQFVDTVKNYSQEQRGKSYAVLINADEFPDLARSFGVQAVPTTTIYLEGMKLRDMVGNVTQERLAQLVEQTTTQPATL